MSMNPPNEFLLPRAAAIVGEIVRAFDFDHPGLTDKAAQRYFSSEVLSDEARAYVLRSLCEELADRRMFPDPIGEQVTPTNRDEVVGILLEHLTRKVTDWESIVGSLRSVATRSSDTHLATYAILRLVTIDLALRNAALLAIRGEDGGQFEIPLWARRNGLSDLIRTLRDACPTQPSATTIAKAIGTETHSVENWLAGRNAPTLRNLSALADFFVTNTPGADREEMRRILFRTRGLYRLAAKIRKVVGDSKFDSLAEHYKTYTRIAFAELRPSYLRVRSPRISAERLLLWGVELEASDEILRKLHAQEDNIVWATDVLWAGRPWFVRLWRVFHALTRDRVAPATARRLLNVQEADAEAATERLAELAQVNFRALDVDAPIPAEARWYLAKCALFEAEPAIAISHMRHLIAEDASHPGYHQWLGFALDQAGRFADAIAEFEIALQLDPTDPNPLAYIGIAHYFSGDRARAIDYFRRAREQIGLANGLDFYFGIALKENGEFGEALSVFEAMLERHPDHAWAADQAAECAFRVGDRRKGRGYATRAMRQGQPPSYEMWRAGKF